MRILGCWIRNRRPPPHPPTDASSPPFLSATRPRPPTRTATWLPPICHAPQAGRAAPSAERPRTAALLPPPRATPSVARPGTATLLPPSSALGRPPCSLRHTPLPPLHAPGQPPCSFRRAPQAGRAAPSAVRPQVGCCSLAATPRAGHCSLHRAGPASRRRGIWRCPCPGSGGPFSTAGHRAI